MKYMIMLFGDEAQFAEMTDEENQAELEKHGAFAAWCEENGISVTSGEELQGSFAARTIRANGTETDGPFLELKEQLGGYYVIDCDNVEQALEAARRCPNYGAIEVRPVTVYDE